MFNRKNLIVILLILSFLGVSSLHLISMANSQMVTPHPCFGVLTGNANCPPATGGASFLSYHLNSLQNFLQAIPQYSGNLLLAIFALVLFFGALLVVRLSESNKELAGLYNSVRRLWERIAISFNNKISAWLTILEKRDPAHDSLWCGFKFAMVPIT